MLRILQYYGKFQGVRGEFGGLPSWARAVIAVLALPGAILLGLSLLAVVVSILALLLLTVPAYRLLSAVTSPGAAGPSGSRSSGGGGSTGSFEPATNPAPFAQASPPYGSPSGRRHVDVKIIE